jgi:hypothetical protein
MTLNLAMTSWIEPKTHRQQEKRIGHLDFIKIVLSWGCRISASNALGSSPNTEKKSVLCASKDISHEFKPQSHQKKKQKQNQKQTKKKKQAMWVHWVLWNKKGSQK